MNARFRSVATTPHAVPRTAATARPRGGSVARVAAAAATACAALLGGCSGEARPFEEAVEVSELDLVALEIERPEGSLSPLVVNPGQRIEFGLSARNSANGSVEISGEDRDWRVSDSSVASISDDGVFVGRADADRVSVDVRIGDVVAQQFDVRVSDSVIGTLVPPGGEELPTELEPCTGTDFRLEALYVDETRRQLTAEDVTWSADTEAAYIDENEDGSVTFSAQRPGGVQLTATAGQASLALPLSVGETLQEIDIGPATLAAEEGEEQQLTATGTFDDGDGGTRSENVTEGVVWSIASGGGDVASVSNEAGSRGLVEAEAEGDAQVVARCGDVSDEDVFQVSEDEGSSGGDDDGLAFEDASSSNVLSVRLSESPVTLRVSTGDEYDSDEDVTDEADFDFQDDEQRLAILLDSNGASQRQLQLLDEGTVRLDVVTEDRQAVLIVRIGD